jgi:hypothetical protein
MVGRDAYRGGGAKGCCDRDGEGHTKTRRCVLLSGGKSERGYLCNISTPCDTVGRLLRNPFDT